MAAESHGDGVVFYTKLMLEYAELHSNPKKIIEKSPDHLKEVKEISRVFPTARFILIVRDPRAAISSCLETPWYNKSAVLGALDYRYQLERALTMSGIDIHLVRYEDLVIHPSATLAEICGFLGVEYLPTMIENDGAHEVIPSWELGWKRNSLNSPNVDSLNKWRRKLSRRESLLIGVFNSKLMRRFGYECPQSRGLSEAMYYSYRVMRDIVRWIRARSGDQSFLK